jgi:hypothetical protein
VMRRLVITLGIVATLVSSCGGSELPSAFADKLQTQVASIRELAEAGRHGPALARLEAMVTIVATGLEGGLIDGNRALEILESAEAVRAQLSLLPRPSPTEAPSPSPVEGDGNGKGKDKGHGDEGHGND